MKRVLLLGTGFIAGAHARAYKAEPGIAVVAAVDTDEGRLAAFADEHGIPNRFRTLEDALAWDGFDAAANTTPDHVHHPTTMRLVAAGKHVHCEKPLAGSYPDAVAMRDAAEAAGVVNMVNLTYRRVAPLHKAREMVLAGAIGTLKQFEAVYFQSWLTGNHMGDWRTGPRWLWRLSTSHGSRGVVGDIGVHVLDFVVFAAGSHVASISSRIKTLPKAEGDRIGEFVLDANDSCIMSLELENGAFGAVQASRWATGYRGMVRLSLFGTEGALVVLMEGTETSLRACLGPDIHTQTWRDVACPPVPDTYQRFAEALRTGVNGEPDFRHAARLQQVLDLCIDRSDAGTVALA